MFNARRRRYRVRRLELVKDYDDEMMSGNSSTNQNDTEKKSGEKIDKDVVMVE